jgi:hypothetical protein
MKSLSGERRRREALVRHVSYFSRAFFVKRESARLFRWQKINHSGVALGTSLRMSYSTAPLDTK